jgi:hypothetical protein
MLIVEQRALEGVIAGDVAAGADVGLEALALAVGTGGVVLALGPGAAGQKQERRQRGSCPTHDLFHR